MINKFNIFKNWLKKQTEYDCVDLGSIEQIGNDLFKVEGMEFVVYTTTEAKKAITDYISESLCYFRPEFLSSYTGVDIKIFEILGDDERANKGIKNIIEFNGSFKKFVACCIKEDGMGIFLSPYDGLCHMHNGLNIFRTN